VLSVVKVTTIAPGHDTGAGIEAPEKVPANVPDDAELPQYTFTKSCAASVLNEVNVSVTGAPVWMSQEHCKLLA